MRHLFITNIDLISNIMFYRISEIQGYQVPFRYLQSGFVKHNGKYFTTMDVTLLFEYVIKKQINEWIRKYDLCLFPYIKVEYSCSMYAFNGEHRQVVKDIDQLTVHPLHAIHDQIAIEELYIRLYFK